MAFAFALTDATSADAVRRIATEELTEALAALDAAAAAGPEGTGPLIHGLRKQVKKLRGLIRLVRPNFTQAEAEDTALRDAARLISGLRDAEVMRQTARHLADAGPKSAGPAFDHLHARFEAHHTALHAASQTENLAAFRGALADALARVPGWELQGEGFALLEEGLASTWSAARKRARAARHEASAEAIHEWRKRVKAHWYQARLLQPIWVKQMAPHAEAAGELGDMLGEHHDLAVFLGHLAEAEITEKERKTIARLARKRQEKLERKAHALADRLFAGKSADLTKRWGAWWESWQEKRD